MLIASPRDCEMRLHLPPTMTGPPRVFDHPRRTYGNSCDTPPKVGSSGMNVGCTSRSSLMTPHDPNNSTRSPSATAPVSPILFTSVRPCRRSKLARKTLNDHLPAGIVSAVGTNHKPVSPLIVGSDGRGVVSPSSTISSEVTTGPEVVVVVVAWPPAGACAAAGAAAKAATRNPQDKVRNNTDARSEEHTSELQSRLHLVCRLLLEKKKKKKKHSY